MWQKRLLLAPAELAPSRNDWEVVGTFNPGVALVDGEVVLLVRVAERPVERRRGQVALPRWDAAAGLVIDWQHEADVEVVDPRVVRLRPTRCVRLTTASHLRVVRCRLGETSVRLEEYRLEPAGPWEELGIEDARITQCAGRYWITYVAVSRHGVATALASTADFREFDRHGIIFPPENKDVVLFPERIGGQYAAIHRPSGATRFSPPGLWLARSDDLVQWGRHVPLLWERQPWEAERVGAGTPPIQTARGWLAIYHGACAAARPGVVGKYQAGALLLDAENPARVLARSSTPLLSPTEPFECDGFVPNVVFPTGLVEHGGRVRVYYGAADTYTAVAEMALGELLQTLSCRADTQMQGCTSRETCGAGRAARAVLGSRSLTSLARLSGSIDGAVTSDSAVRVAVGCRRSFAVGH